MSDVDQDFLAMSDEDFAKVDTAFLDVPSDEEESTDEQDGGDPAIAEGDDIEAEANDQQDSDDDQDGETDEEDDETDPGTGTRDDDDSPGDSDGDDSTDDGDADPGDGEGTDDDQGEDAGVTAEDFLKQVTAPFQANGKQMQVGTADDVIRLMQMGANYNRKMAALKPNMKMLKTLENAGVLSEEKLNYLIDLDKKNPAAIAKLLKDSKVDPLDLDLESGEEYQASNHTADDREVALDSVVEEIKDSPTYPQTIKIVSNEWDAASKQVVADNPQLLKLINSQVATGVYERISTEVERERVFGRLDGMSDIEAYRQVGDAIDARGGFDDLFKNEQPQQNTQPAEDPAPAKAAAKRKDKRRAASPTKAAAPAAKDRDFNPLAMSDEEYMKQFDPRLL